jgi:nucleotide-binding universal stress UspA family protein
MFKTIVHPTDLSDASVPALQAAHELAKELGSKLLVCYIAHSPLVATGDSITDPTTNEIHNIADELTEIQASDPAVDRELRIVIAEKSTRVKTLLKFLEEMDCDLLVIGMHKSPGVTGWLGTSITDQVVRHAGCAVMVVKQHGHEYDFDAIEEIAATVDSESGE